MSYRYPSLQGKRDATEPAIIAALQSVGAVVTPLPTGKGVPDLLVGYVSGGVPTNFLLEVKTAKGTLNAKQVKYHQAWPGQIDVVRTPQEALIAIGADILARYRMAGL